MNALVLRLLAVPLLLAGCAKSRDHDHAGGGHAHVAPHGGTLVEVGEHRYNVELVRDSTAGRLTAYILDAHAENFVRLKATEIAFVAMPAGQFTPLKLRAVANPATGETVGNTSQFEVEAAWLKTAPAFSGIFTVEINGMTFRDVEYAVPGAAEPATEAGGTNPVQP